MFADANRQGLRLQYIECWSKKLSNQTLTALESQIVAVIEGHPEYHQFLTGSSINREFSSDAIDDNPFLHMSMHLAIQDQVSTDRPAGFKRLYKKLANKHPNQHDLQHKLMLPLQEALMLSQVQGSPIDDQQYIKIIKRHLNLR